MGRPKSKCWVCSKKWCHPLHDLSFPDASLSPSGKWADSYPLLTTVLAIPLADRCHAPMAGELQVSPRRAGRKGLRRLAALAVQRPVLSLPVARKEVQGVSNPSHPLPGQHNLSFGVSSFSKHVRYLICSSKVPARKSAMGGPREMTQDPKGRPRSLSDRQPTGPRLH